MLNESKELKHNRTRPWRCKASFQKIHERFVVIIDLVNVVAFVHKWNPFWVRLAHRDKFGKCSLGLDNVSDEFLENINQVLSEVIPREV